MNDLYTMGLFDGEAKAKVRIEFLERLIEKYASHVECWIGLYLLEDRFRGDNSFTDKEWAEIRLLAKENEG